MNLLASLAAILFLFSTHLNAQTNCFCSSDEGVNDTRGLLHPVVDYYEGEPRRLVSTLPRAQAKAFNATGTLRCNGWLGSAQLTVKKNVITTVAHILFDKETCTRHARASDCKFYTFSHGATRAFEVSDEIGVGFKCPSDHTSTDDWAVLKLKNEIDDVEPYPVNPQKVENLRVRDKVIAIGHSKDFHHEAEHYGRCEIGHIDGHFTPWFMSAPCGCSEGCSGGSLLTDDLRHDLVGIQVATDETEDDIKEAVAQGYPKVFHYKDDVHATYYVPVTGDFLSAIEKAAGEKLN